MGNQFLGRMTNISQWILPRMEIIWDQIVKMRTSNKHIVMMRTRSKSSETLRISFMYQRKPLRNLEERKVAQHVRLSRQKEMGRAELVDTIPKNADSESYGKWKLILNTCT